jgi:GTPase SAR1 family protein
MDQDPGTIYFTGTAGAGKTTLVYAFQKWLKSAGHDAIVVNMDPGAEQLPGEPDVDIREWVRLADVMDEYDLGPNGAQVAAADLAALKIFEVKQAIDESRTDYILIDTPGQIELFAFRESSRAIVDAIGGDRSLIAFLFDPALARKPAGFVTLLMLGATVEFRFRLPTINVLSKSDVMSPEERDRIIAWSDQPDALEAAVSEGPATPDWQLSAEVFRALEALAPLSALHPVSAADGSGMESVYRGAQRVFGGDDDLEVSQAPPEEP